MNSAVDPLIPVSPYFGQNILFELRNTFAQTSDLLFTF